MPPLLYALAALIIVGLVALLVNTRISMAEHARALVNVVLTLIVVGSSCGPSTLTSRWR